MAVEMNERSVPQDGIRARTTSLHYTLNTQTTATCPFETVTADISLPTSTPSTATAVTGAAEGTAATAGPAIIEGRVMPWLQEAMQTVAILESRLQELEEDCKVRK